LKDSLRDREQDKFRASGEESKVAVTLEGDTGLLEGIQYDDIQATYPTTSSERYAYYLSGVLQVTIEVTYTNSSKNVFLRARRI
jgi:hypothetical protein